ncbi:hypothetical protein PflCFBP13510_17840 [Pseudomonas fluorescens]|nr:hypothetical protein PflCFBP13510_17840 [Pseudomonas fluorescens]
MAAAPTPCGSWLACDGGRSIDSDVDCAAPGNHDAKRAALALDLLLILISGAPLNHAGRTQA